MFIVMSVSRAGEGCLTWRVSAQSKPWCGFRAGLWPLKKLDLVLIVSVKADISCVYIHANQQERTSALVFSLINRP